MDWGNTQCNHQFDFLYIAARVLSNWQIAAIYHLTNGIDFARCFRNSPETSKNRANLLFPFFLRFPLPGSYGKQEITSSRGSLNMCHQPFLGNMLISNM